jgi:hypothetical protein
MAYRTDSVGIFYSFFAKQCQPVGILYINVVVPTLNYPNLL